MHRPDHKMTSIRRRAWNLRTQVEDLRAATRLAVVATQGVCDLVEEMHETIASGPNALGRPFQRPTRAINTLTYGSVRSVTRFVGASIDGALSQLGALLGPPSDQTSRSFSEEVVLAAINGVLGDYLQETGNPLAIPMRFRHQGIPLDPEPRALLKRLPDASRKLLIQIHGSCMSDRQWLRQGHDHGAALSRDLGYTPVHLQYNTGLHISTNGSLFAESLDRLIHAWPVPLDEIVILAHSMGGLVARSGCHVAEKRLYPWRTKLRAMIFLGTPHHGAPLERGGILLHQILEISRYSAPLARLGKIRSAGVTDLRYGTVLDEDWQGKDRFAYDSDTRTPLPLPPDVACYAIAATKSREGAKQLQGDGIVPVPSALGRHRWDAYRLAFPETHQWIGYGMSHLDLLSRPEVYATLRRWLAQRSP